MGRGGKRVGAGRPKGATGRDPEAAEKFVDECFARFKAATESAKGKGDGKDAEDLVVDLLRCGNHAIIERVWERLIEYKFGKPLARVETSGKDGGPVLVSFDTPVSPHVKRQANALRQTSSPVE